MNHPRGGVQKGDCDSQCIVLVATTAQVWMPVGKEAKGLEHPLFLDKTTIKNQQARKNLDRSATCNTTFPDKGVWRCHSLLLHGEFSRCIKHDVLRAAEAQKLSSRKVERLDPDATSGSPKRAVSFINHLLLSVPEPRCRRQMPQNSLSFQRRNAPAKIRPPTYAPCTGLCNARNTA